MSPARGEAEVGVVERAQCVGGAVGGPTLHDAVGVEHLVPVGVGTADGERAVGRAFGGGGEREDLVHLGGALRSVSSPRPSREITVSGR